MEAKPKARTGPSRDARRQSMLDAAKVLFAEKGYHDTTVDDITRSANVAKGTFYLYFSEKRAIYHEVIKSFLEMVKEVGNLVEEPTSSPTEFVARTRRSAQSLMAVLSQNRQLAHMAYREALGLDPHLAELLREFYREVAEVAAANLELAIRIGVVRPVHPLLQAYVQIGMVERVMLEILEHPDDFPPLAQVVDEMLRTGYEGMRGPSGPPWVAMFPDQ